MLELPLQDQCEVIYVPCLLANLSTGEQCIVDAVWDTGSQRTVISEEAFKAIGLNRGPAIQVQGSAGLTEGWTTECKVLTPTTMVQDNMTLSSQDGIGWIRFARSTIMLVHMCIA